MYDIVQMQLANRIHLGKIFVWTVLDALHAIKMHFKTDALLGHTQTILW